MRCFCVIAISRDMKVDSLCGGFFCRDSGSLCRASLWSVVEKFVMENLTVFLFLLLLLLLLSKNYAAIYVIQTIWQAFKNEARQTKWRAW